MCSKLYNLSLKSTLGFTLVSKDFQIRKCFLVFTNELIIRKNRLKLTGFNLKYLKPSEIFLLHQTKFQFRILLQIPNVAEDSLQEQYKSYVNNSL